MVEVQPLRKLVLLWP